MQDGKKVNPSAAEVRATTGQHAEMIIDLMDGHREIERQLVGHRTDQSKVGAERARLKDQIRTGIEKFDPSFGKEAGKRLKAYCRRQSLSTAEKRAR